MGDRLGIHDVVDILWLLGDNWDIRQNFCQKWDLNPRPHTRTRILTTLPIKEARLCLESGALDHSAILTDGKLLPKNFIWQKSLAERSFDLRTSGLWAQHASTAPLCCFSSWKEYSYKYLKYQLIIASFINCDHCKIYIYWKKTSRHLHFGFWSVKFLFFLVHYSALYIYYLYLE